MVDQLGIFARGGFVARTCWGGLLSVFSILACLVVNRIAIFSSIGAATSASDTAIPVIVYQPSPLLSGSVYRMLW